MKKICFSLIISLILCSAASAHILYTTEAGNLGLIAVDSVESADVSANKYAGGSGSLVASYWENNTSNGAGNSKIIFITPTEQTASVSGDTAVRFSSYSNLSTPIDNKAITLVSTYGTPIICGTNSGGSLYLATGATLREYKTSDFRLYNSYTYPSADVALNPEIKAVIKDNNKIYLLVNLNNSVSNDVIMMLEGTLRPDSKYSGKWEIKNSQKTAYSMNYISNSRIAVGCSDGVYHVTNNSATSLVSSDYPVVAVHQDTGSGFYYITQSEDNGVKTNYLRHYENSTTDTAVASLTGITGSTAALVKDTGYNVLGVMIGEQISLLNMEDDTLIKTFTSTNLSGKPISIAASSTSGNSADTSSGCNSISNNVLLCLVFLGLLLMKNKFGRR